MLTFAFVVGRHKCQANRVKRTFIDAENRHRKDAIKQEEGKLVFIYDNNDNDCDYYVR